MDIKPIETVYKGYRFRSRLEARWAIALDYSGVQWQYEPEGFQIDDVKVLPDFYLPQKKMYLEVKPQKDIHIYRDLPRLYFAGKMGAPTDNKLPGRCWRSFYPVPEYTEFDDTPEAMLLDVSGKQFLYTGPFKGIGDYHGYKHGITTCGAVSEQAILSNALNGIGFANHFLAYIEDETAFGTLAEIGYAKAFGKKIFIAFNERLRANGDEFTPDCYFLNHMWFAAAMANKTMWVANEQEAVEQLFAQVTFKETNKDIRALAKLDGYAIVFGDPEEHQVVTQKTIRENYAAPYCLPFIKPEAAVKARQARFEHGEVPA